APLHAQARVRASGRLRRGGATSEEPLARQLLGRRKPGCAPSRRAGRSVHASAPPEPALAAPSRRHLRARPDAAARRFREGLVSRRKGLAKSCACAVIVIWLF